MTSYSVNQWCPSLLTHICVISLHNELSNPLIGTYLWSCSRCSDHWVTYASVWRRRKAHADGFVIIPNCRGWHTALNTNPIQYWFMKTGGNHWMDKRWPYYSWPPGLLFNSSPHGQNGCHFADDNSNAFSWMKSFVFWLNFHWSLFLRVQLTITQHWFR